MRTLIFLFIGILLGLVAYETFADEVTIQTTTETRDINTDVPEFLKGAMITVRLRDGRESTVHAERFKVVPRKQQFIVTKIKETTSVVQTKVVEVKSEPLKNRLNMLAGEGPTGQLTKSVSNGVLTVSEERGPVGGVQYTHQLKEEVSIGGQALTNKTFLFTIGSDF
jgi:hypothetical protein